MSIRPGSNPKDNAYGLDILKSDCMDLDRIPCNLLLPTNFLNTHACSLKILSGLGLEQIQVVMDRNSCKCLGGTVRFLKMQSVSDLFLHELGLGLHTESKTHEM